MQVSGSFCSHLELLDDFCDVDGLGSFEFFHASIEHGQRIIKGRD